MTKHTLRTTLPALIAAGVLLMSGCSTDKDAPGVAPGEARPSVTATVAPSATPSVDPTKGTEQITQPKVDTATEAVAMYGEASVKAAQATVNDYAYAMTAPQIQTGILNGKDAVETFGNLVDRDLYEELMSKPDLQPKFYVQQPATSLPDKVKTLSLYVTDVKPTTEFRATPALSSKVTVAYQMTYGSKVYVFERTVKVWLFQQADTSEGEWRISGFHSYGDKDVTAKYPAQ